MFGTIVNVIAVVVGGTLGLLLKKGIKSEIMDSVMKAEGVAVFIIGMNGVLVNMLSVGTDGKITDNGGLILLISLALGMFIGEIIKLDDRINGFGGWIEKKVKSDGFSKGFVSAFIIYCVGSMSIIGAINDGLSGDSSVLLVKSTLDFITAMVLGSAMGIGAVFAAAPLFVYQGAISLFSSFIKPVIESCPDMMTHFTMVGYAIIMCIGINFIAGQKIKTANLLPAMLVPVLYNVLKMVENLW
ncbi:MAG: DUF554 domain-containing protein [Oscillospiraceae bacterium]|nr:DUF554 domain-containing protein [Oscillospiraceae bacterium]